METTPAGKTGTAPKNWKDYIGWVGLIVTAGIFLEQIYSHGTGVYDVFFGVENNLLFTITNSEYTLLHHFAVLFYIARLLFFSLYPLAVFIPLVMRKKFVPRLLVIFAAVAVFSTFGAEVIDNMLALEYGETVYISLMSVVYFVIDIALLLFYTKFTRFRALFIK